MKLRSESPVGVMEGKGFYNEYAAIPASGSALALPLLEEAARQISLDSSDRPIVIADYGSSQGKNSLAPMRAAIAVLRARVGTQRPIVVYHTDLPANDFSTLFEVLESDPASYLQDEHSVFPSAIGRSFYRPILPPSHVDLAWSSYAAVWLSRIPPPDPRPFLHSLHQRCCSCRVRAPGRSGLEDVPVAARHRVAPRWPPGCRTSLTC